MSFGFNLCSRVDQIVVYLAKITLSVKTDKVPLCKEMLAN